MEKQIKDLTILEGYYNQQVILNYYNVDDFLWKRDGFHFDSIQLINEKLLLFSKEDGHYLTIPLENYETIACNNEFQNYFILRNGEERLEIYFP